MSKQRANDADFERMLADREFYGQRTRQVFEERLGNPLDGHIRPIAVDLIDADPSQPRRSESFDPESLKTLASSIGEHGLLHALVVRPTDGGRYQIVAGERRYRAIVQHLKWPKVMCLVRKAENWDALVMALVENLHRKDLTDMEKSDALVRLQQMTSDEWTEIAGRVKLSYSRVQALLQLQRLAPDAQELVREGQLSGKKASALLPLDPAEQIELAREAVVEDLKYSEILARARQRKVRNSRGQTATSSTELTAGSNPCPAEHNPTRAAGTVELPKVPGVVAELWTKLDDTYRLLHSIGGLPNEEACRLTEEKLQRVLQVLRPR